VASIIQHVVGLLIMTWSGVRYAALSYLEKVLESHVSKFAAGSSVVGDRALLSQTGDDKVSDDWRTVLTYRAIQRGDPRLGLNLSLYHVLAQ